MPSASDELLYRIRGLINYETLFAEFLQLRGHGHERRARCIFHDDENPSMSVNVEEGRYCCHVPACGAQGDFIDFYMRVRDLTFPQAVEELARRCGIAPNERTTQDETRGVIDEAVVDATHARLLATESAMTFLSTRRGLTQASVERWKLGHDGDRYYIPIRDELGRCVNIRRYKPGAASSEKMISWRQGFGNARIWPFDSIERAMHENCPIYIFEGEMDCLLALQLGLCAVTATGGAGTWRETWNILFSGRDVVICYDCDDAGRIGSLNVANALHAGVNRVRVVTLPLAEPAGADFTDFIVGHGYSIDDFLSIVVGTPEYRPTNATQVHVEQEPIAVHLSAASKAEYYNLPIRVGVMVSGKTTAPYLAPRRVRMTCTLPGLPMCTRCPVAGRAGTLDHEMTYESNEILQFVNVPDATVKKLIKQQVGIPSRCSVVEQEVTEALNVEELQLIPEIDRTDEEAPYVTRTAYYVGHGLQANRSYLMNGITVPTPYKQMATHIIHTAIPSQSNIDAFRLTPDVVTRLQRFQPDRARSSEALWHKVNDIYSDLEAHTRIYQRRDLMLCVDLVYHSLLSFVFQGERLARGWCEALVIGDSRTGKTSIVSRMMDYYSAGELSSGENTSLAGLVGGLHQIGNSWALSWGRVPLNDRRLLAIDEAGNLPLDQIARLSSMRSSGIAEIIKVHTERTNARTRQIWISNPRNPNPLSSYSQGVLAVKELLGEPSDVARFDLVVTAASDDVDLSVINAQRVADEPRRYTRDICHQRVMWAWSRTFDQIVFDPEAEVLALQRATEQGVKYQYTTEIPLVEPNEQRIKLARLGAAAAALFFSASEDGERVLVMPEHIDFAYQLLEQLYAKPSLAYDEYAEQRRRSNEVDNEYAIDAIIQNTMIMRQLLEQQQFTQRDLQEIFGYDDRDHLRRTVTTLRNSGFLLRYGTSYYVKTPAAIRWLRQHIVERTNGNGHLNGRELAPALPDIPTF